jgi:NADH-quinone oxidoreductase subunit C
VSVSVDVAPTSAPPDVLTERLFQNLATDLGNKILESVVRPHDLIIRVDAADWLETAKIAKRAGFTYFCFLSGLDWLVSPLQTTRYENVWGSVEEEATEEGSEEAVAEEAAAAEIEVAPAVAEVAGFQTGLAGGATRFQVMLRLTATPESKSVTIKADLDESDPRVQSIVSAFGGANWHERETWEMFGFWFNGHPNLVHIYLPGSFEGYPLRKDFPLLAREVKPWPGLTNVEPIAGQADDETTETAEA